MSLLKHINKIVLTEDIAATAATLMLVENCNQMDIPTAAMKTLVESAEEFLGQLAVNIQSGKISKDENDNALRDNMTMLTVLDLLRNAQARTAVNANSIKGYLQITDGVSRHLAKSGVEVKVMQELDRMRSPDGKPGMDVRDEYIKMAAADDVTPLVQQIKKLESQYQQIQAKMKTAAGNVQPTTGAQPQQNGAVPQPAG